MITYYFNIIINSWHKVVFHIRNSLNRYKRPVFYATKKFKVGEVIPKQEAQEV